MSAPAVAFDELKSRSCLRDYAVGNVPINLQQELEAASSDWLASADFALRYAFPPAQRVWIRLDEYGLVQHAYYYNEEPSTLGKRLILNGPVEMDFSEARELLLRRKAVRLDVLRMGTPNFAETRPGMTKPTVALYGEDVMVVMPATKQELLASLGSNKRQQLGKYTRRLQKEWPSGIEWVSLSRSDITQEMFRAVVQFNSLRLTAKGRLTLWREAMITQRWDLATHSGLLCGLRLNGKFVSGAVSYLYGRDAYYVLIGHDPEYDYWNLGNLTTWLTLEKCLERGIRRFHFLWGLSEYKLRFGGEAKPLYTLSIYRNYPAKIFFSSMDLVPASKAVLRRTAHKIHISLRNSELGRRLFPRSRPTAGPRQTSGIN
jgi:GNAT acetyltransferase-like protein